MGGSEGAVAGVAAACVAPAKINLVLEIVGRRSDGFHALRSIFAPLELADRLSVALLAVGTSDRLTIRGATAGECGPADRNLVLRAAAALRADSARPGPPLAFTLTKHIPVAAGLGGGSSDAVAALDLATAAWGSRLGDRRRRRLAAALGSDVPFFTLGGWALVGGRGERLTRLPGVAGVGVLLVTPAVHVLTAGVYAAWDVAHGDATTPEGSTRAAGHVHSPDRRGSPSPAVALAARIREGMRARDLAGIPPSNDLWTSVAGMVPGLAGFRDDLASLLGRAVHLSGSGPTLFALFGSPAGATAAMRTVRLALEDRSLRAPGGALPRVTATQTVGARE